MTETKPLTEAQIAEVARLKSYFPYRIAYGAVRGSEFVSGAVSTMREPNKLARNGWHVEVAK